MSDKHYHYVAERLLAALVSTLAHRSDLNLTKALITLQEEASNTHIRHLLQHVEMTVREIQLKEGIIK